MIDNLYSNIGEKIKTWAKWIFIIESVCAVISSFALMGNDAALAGFILLFAGPLAALVSTWLLYAFGQLVEDVSALRNQSIPQPATAPKEETKPAERMTYSNLQHKTGTCELCGANSDQLVYCKIEDDLGTRYREICDNCIAKHNAIPQK